MRRFLGSSGEMAGLVALLLGCTLTWVALLRGGTPACAETHQCAALLLSAGRGERWLLPPRGPASAAPSIPRSETAACPQGDADQGGPSAAPAPTGGGPRALGRPSSHQEHPRDSPAQEGTSCSLGPWERGACGPSAQCWAHSTGAPVLSPRPCPALKAPKRFSSDSFDVMILGVAYNRGCSPLQCRAGPWDHPAEARPRIPSSSACCSLETRGWRTGPGPPLPPRSPSVQTRSRRGQVYPAQGGRPRPASSLLPSSLDPSLSPVCAPAEANPPRRVRLVLLCPGAAPVPCPPPPAASAGLLCSFAEASAFPRTERAPLAAEASCLLSGERT